MNTTSDAALVERFLDHIDLGDHRGALDLATEQLDVTGVSGAVNGLLAPAQRTVGDRWHAGRYTVAQEHVATAVVDDALGVTSSRVHAPDRDANALALVCAEGEWHSTPARMAALVIRDAGWRVHFLGASTPSDHLAITLDNLAPQAVAISCTIPLALPGVPPLIDIARRLDIPVLVGGRAFDPDGHRARRLGADGHVADPTDAVATLNDWLDRPPRRHAETADAQIAEQRNELAARHPQIVAAAYELLEARLPVMAAFDDRQRHHTRQDLDYILQYADIAVLVDDPTLFTDFVTWLTQLLTTRGLPPTVMPVTLAAISEVTGHDLPAVRHVLGAAGPNPPH